MSEPIKQKPEASDEEFVKEQERYYSANLDCQFMAEIYTQAAEEPPPWLTPEKMLELWPLSERMTEIATRPDLRLSYMLTGVASSLPAKTTRNMKPAFQAEMMDQLRENGDKTAKEQVAMFDYKVLMAHTDRAKRFAQFVGCINWSDESEASKKLFKLILASGLKKDRLYKGTDGKDKAHKPIVTSHEVLSAVDKPAYVQLINKDTRVQIMLRRLECETQGKFLSAEEELQTIVTIDKFCDELPNQYQQPIVQLVRKNIGYPEAKTDEVKTSAEQEGPKAR